MHILPPPPHGEPDYSPALTTSQHIDPMTNLKPKPNHIASADTENSLSEWSLGTQSWGMWSGLRMQNTRKSAICSEPSTGGSGDAADRHIATSATTTALETTKRHKEDSVLDSGRTGCYPGADHQSHKHSPCRTSRKELIGPITNLV